MFVCNVQPLGTHYQRRQITGQCSPIYKFETIQILMYIETPLFVSIEIDIANHRWRLDFKKKQFVFKFLVYDLNMNTQFFELSIIFFIQYIFILFVAFHLN